MRSAGRWAADQRGVALVTTLLFMVLVLILISAMLTVTGNEIVISGLQRDSTRALEVAEAGIREAIRRIEVPHFFGTNAAQDCYDSDPSTGTNAFQNSLALGTATVRVCRHAVGPSGALLEIQSDARVNRAIRKLSTIVLQVVEFLPPNILYGHDIAEQGNAAQVASGDAYSQTYIRYVGLPNADTFSYAGWRISKSNPNAIPACYTHQDCLAQAGVSDSTCAANPNADPRCRWYPGQRITVPLSSALGADLDSKTALCRADGTPDFANPPLPTGAIRADDPTQTPVPADTTVPTYGFMTDDPDGGGGVPPQAKTPNLPCGLAYKYDAMPVRDEGGNLVAGGNPAGTRHFKTIVYEHWFWNYYRFDTANLTWTQRDGRSCPDDTCLSADPSLEPNLAGYPQFAAVPPFPDFTQVTPNADRTETVPRTINSGDFGTCVEGSDGVANTCDDPSSRPIIVLLDGGDPDDDDWHINGTLTGHGTVLVNGDLITNGTFTYWGTIIVNGNLTLGSGNMTIYGGLVAKSTAYLTGNITVWAGGLVPNIPVGRAKVTTRTWWER